MKKTKILINMPISKPHLAELQAMPEIECVLVDDPQEEVRLLPEKQIKDCEMFFTTFLPENHKQMEKLKVVQIASVGYTQLFDHGLNQRGIKACNAVGVQDVPIAEWNIAMMINLKRDMRGMMRNQDGAIWDRGARFQREIFGGTLGIWGYGGIGRQTARLAKALNMKIHVMTLDGKLEDRSNCWLEDGCGDPEGIFPDKIFSLNEKSEFLNKLDFLVMAIPLTQKTTGIVGETELKMLPRHAFVLNPARGPLIQEQALIDTLTNGVIAGAALDTHYYYPMPPEHPFWKMDNVILTPHISGSSAGPRFIERIWSIWLENVKRYIKGKRLLNQLSEAQINGK
jgi:phosphoglycerate dehydrogenase-like enzyme